jgi:hypothetical protein
VKKARSRRPLNAIINLLQDRYILKPDHRKAVTNWLYPKVICAERSAYSATEEVAALKRQGQVFMPDMPETELAELKTLATQNRLFDPWSQDLGTFNLASVPKSVHVAKVVGVQQSAVAWRVATAPHLMKAMYEYFGRGFWIDAVDMWWSFPNSGAPQEAEKFHRDRDSLSFVKLFVYLTDVDENSGPHQYVLGSACSEQLIENRRFTDSEVTKAFPEDLCTIAGAAGTCFLENTFGIHRGLQPLLRPRLIFQVRYSIHPSIFRGDGLRRMDLDAKAKRDIKNKT